MNIKIIIFLLSACLHFSLGYYIKSRNDEKLSLKNGVKAPAKDEWSFFKQKLGISDKNIELLKSQKDQKATKELVRKFIKESIKYGTIPAEKKQTPKEEVQDNLFVKIFENFVQNLRMAKASMVKTSLKFVLTDKSQKELNRPRRKISVKMVTDMTTERVDNMLKMFYEQHGIKNHVNYLNSDADVYANDDEVADDDKDDFDYGDMPSSSIQEPDYSYDNLYDDEQDLTLSAKSRQNSQYGSFQDFIMQAERKQWERENEEAELYRQSD